MRVNWIVQVHRDLSSKANQVSKSVISFKHKIMVFKNNANYCFIYIRNDG